MQEERSALSHLLCNKRWNCPAGEGVDGEDDTDSSFMSGLARSLRVRLEEERRRTEDAEAELDRQRASNAGLGASLSRLEAQMAAKKAFWEVWSFTILLIVHPSVPLAGEVSGVFALSWRWTASWGPWH